MCSEPLDAEGGQQGGLQEEAEGVPLVPDGGFQGLESVHKGLEGRRQKQVGAPLEPEDKFQLIEEGGPLELGDGPQMLEDGTGRYTPGAGR